MTSIEDIKKVVPWYTGDPLATDKHGDTPLICWIRRAQKPIPLELMYHVYHVEGCDKIVMHVQARKRLSDDQKLYCGNYIVNGPRVKLIYEWIMNRRMQPIPKILFDPAKEPPIRDDKYDLLSSWIRYRYSEPIPEILLAPYMIRPLSEPGDTMLGIWIRYRKMESIPKEILCNPLVADNNGDTPLMLWIMYRPGEHIPKELLHDPLLANNYGYTAMMLWIIYRKREPIDDSHVPWGKQRRSSLPPLPCLPKELLHDIGITDNKGRTPLELWSWKRGRERIPDTLLYNRYIDVAAEQKDIITDLTIERDCLREESKVLHRTIALFMDAVFPELSSRFDSKVPSGHSGHLDKPSEMTHD